MFMMNIKFRVGGSTSASNPPPPPPPPSAVAGGSSERSLNGEGIGAGGPPLPSTPNLTDQYLLISDKSVGDSSSDKNLHLNYNNQIYISLAVGGGFLPWCAGKRSSRKLKSRYYRLATPQPSGFGGGSSSSGGINFKPHGTVGFPIYRSMNMEDNRMVVGGSGSSVSKSGLGKRQGSAERKRVPSSSGGPSKKHKPDDTSAQLQQPKISNRGMAAEVAGLKMGGGVVSGPTGIVVELTKEEKEEDFLKLTGAKLPRKPDRRPRAVEKDLLYCFPGMFLSDVSSSKYDVVEEKKKSRKSRRRELKGIVESSDSE